MLGQQIANLAVLTFSARASKDLDYDRILEACSLSLKGRTPDEPDPHECARHIEKRGFHIHAGMAWGLNWYGERKRYELDRLIEVNEGKMGAVQVGRAINEFPKE